MSIGILYTFSDPSVESQLVLATAAYADLDLERVIIQYGEEKEEKYLEKFPSGKVPGFEQDGFYLTGGTAIAYYLARLTPACDLVPSDMEDAALVDQWVSFAEHELDMKIDDLGEKRSDVQMYYVMDLIEKSRSDMCDLRRHLTMRLHILGMQLTLADIVITSVLTYGLHETEGYLSDYHRRMVSHPKLAPIFAEKSRLPIPLFFSKATKIMYFEDDDEWKDKSQSESESIYMESWRWIT